MNNSNCALDHRYDVLFANLPFDQGGKGRHKCCGCAYDKGLEDGKNLLEVINIDLENLPFSQAGTVRHKSPHAAYAQGYYDGVKYYYDNL
ncbi:MAG: hypothetical protein ABI543_09380 [Ignavibacteria bacterium]